MAANTSTGNDVTLDDAALEAQVVERQAKRKARELGGDDTGDAATGPELIKKLADGDKVDAEEAVDAMEWFLSPDDGSFTHRIKLNVGSPTNEKWIEWEIAPVDLDTLKKIREASQGGSRAQRRRSQNSGEMDEVEANIRIVIEGTVYPDLKAIANEKRLVDPGDALRQKFAHKPGLLGQLSGEIMSISGYDDEDVREVEAAKNS